MPRQYVDYPAPLVPEALQGILMNPNGGLINPIEKIQWIAAQDYGFHLWNYISTLGAYLSGFAVLVFLGIVFYTLFFGRKVGANYWNADKENMTFEWTLSSPPPFHQFEIQPTVK